VTDKIGNAFDLLGDTTDNGAARVQRENAARGGIIDGRKRKRVTRTEQVAMKTSPARREQHQRIALRMGVTFVEAYETALDALEEKLNREGI
jgi:hypothetical protein